VARTSSARPLSPDFSSGWRTDAIRADLAAQMRGARARQTVALPAEPSQERAEPRGPIAVLLFSDSERARRIRIALGVILLLGVLAAFAAAGAEGLLLPDVILMGGCALVFVISRAWSSLPFRPVTEPNDEQMARVREQLDRAAGNRSRQLATADDDSIAD
jgi:hypothetical protein